MNEPEKTGSTCEVCKKKWGWTATCLGHNENELIYFCEYCALPCRGRDRLAEHMPHCLTKAEFEKARQSRGARGSIKS